MDLKWIFNSTPTLNYKMIIRVYSRDNLSKSIKSGVYVINFEEYVINFEEYADFGTHWIALCASNNGVIYFDSFGVEYIPKEVQKIIENKDIETNIFRIIFLDSTKLKIVFNKIH